MCVTIITIVTIIQRKNLRKFRKWKKKNDPHWLTIDMRWNHIVIKIVNRNATSGKGYNNNINKNEKQNKHWTFSILLKETRNKSGFSFFWFFYDRFFFGTLLTIPLFDDDDNNKQIHFNDYDYLLTRKILFVFLPSSSSSNTKYLYFLCLSL